MPTWWVAALVTTVVVSLAACGGSGPTSATSSTSAGAPAATTPASEATPTPAATPEGSPTSAASPSPTPTPPQSVADLALAPGAFGPLRMGDSIERATALDMIAWVTVCGDEKGWWMGEAVSDDASKIEYIPTAVTEDTVRAMLVKGDQWRTTAGLASGDTIDDARRIYPDLAPSGHLDGIGNPDLDIFTVGSPETGYLDLYAHGTDDPQLAGQITAAVVRTADVPIQTQANDAC